MHGDGWMVIPTSSPLNTIPLDQSPTRRPQEGSQNMGSGREILCRAPEGADGGLVTFRGVEPQRQPARAADSFGRLAAPRCVPQESDLTFRLTSGLLIWQAMWEHRQPEVPAFSALIKPVRNIVTGGPSRGLAGDVPRHPAPRLQTATVYSGTCV